MSLITIDQLLESIDLEFEPRFVTKDKSGIININSKNPKCGICSWIGGGDIVYFERIKLAEFENKPWTECIYEVPRKTTGKIKKIEVYGTLLDYKFNPMGKFEPMCYMELINKINELVEAVNKLKKLS